MRTGCYLALGWAGLGWVRWKLSGQGRSLEESINPISSGDAECWAFRTADEDGGGCVPHDGESFWADVKPQRVIHLIHELVSRVSTCKLSLFLPPCLRQDDDNQRIHVQGVMQSWPSGTAIERFPCRSAPGRTAHACTLAVVERISCCFYIIRCHHIAFDHTQASEYGVQAALPWRWLEWDGMGSIRWDGMDMDGTRGGIGSTWSGANRRVIVGVLVPQRALSRGLWQSLVCTSNVFLSMLAGWLSFPSSPSSSSTSFFSFLSVIPL
ncbi:hypothetical protein J3F84DRAFT_355053 [Trichoderma pleuroticola]